MNILDSYKIQRKVNKCRDVIRQALEKFGSEKTAVAWTGGKDSTLILWTARDACRKWDIPFPRVVFIDEGDLFPEIIDFTKKISKLWNFSFTTAKNTDVTRQVKKLGDKVIIKKLNARNREEIKRLGYDKPDFPFEPESFVGNHLMKTVALNVYIENNHIDALITGIRKDENTARARESYFSPRENPPHTRVHPILDFVEADVWAAIHANSVPYVSLYEQGYRSLGAKSTTKKAGAAPAWRQDMKSVPERAGRRQDKEKIMEKLRKLGYM